MTIRDLEVGPESSVQITLKPRPRIVMVNPSRSRRITNSFARRSPRTAVAATRPVPPRLPWGTRAAARSSRSRISSCGLEVAAEAFRQLDPQAVFEVRWGDGSRVQREKSRERARRCACIARGRAHCAELSAAVSGIATLTATFRRCRRQRHHHLDTRKTTPGFRVLEKYAVRCGGGPTHRHASTMEF